MHAHARHHANGAPWPRSFAKFSLGQHALVKCDHEVRVGRCGGHAVLDEVGHDVHLRRDEGLGFGVLGLGLGLGPGPGEVGGGKTAHAGKQGTCTRGKVRARGQGKVSGGRTAHAGSRVGHDRR